MAGEKRKLFLGKRAKQHARTLIEDRDLAGRPDRVLWCHIQAPANVDHVLLLLLADLDRRKRSVIKQDVDDRLGRVGSAELARTRTHTQQPFLVVEQQV